MIDDIIKYLEDAAYSDTVDPALAMRLREWAAWLAEDQQRDRDVVITEVEEVEVESEVGSDALSLVLDLHDDRADLLRSVGLFECAADIVRRS